MGGVDPAGSGQVGGVGQALRPSDQRARRRTKATTRSRRGASGAPGRAGGQAGPLWGLGNGSGCRAGATSAGPGGGVAPPARRGSPPAKKSKTAPVRGRGSSARLASGRGAPGGVSVKPPGWPPAAPPWLSPTCRGSRGPVGRAPRARQLSDQGAYRSGLQRGREFPVLATPKTKGHGDNHCFHAPFSFSGQTTPPGREELAHPPGRGVRRACRFLLSTDRPRSGAPYHQQEVKTWRATRSPSFRVA